MLISLFCVPLDHWLNEFLAICEQSRLVRLSPTLHIVESLSKYWNLEGKRNHIQVRNDAL
jgi:hypothetical protein